MPTTFAGLKNNDDQRHANTARDARDQLIKDTKMYKVKNKIPVVQARIGRAGIFPVGPVL